MSTVNTSQQPVERPGLLSCQAMAPKMGSPALITSSATPASAYVQRCTSVAPRVQPNSKAKVAEAAMQPSTATPKGLFGLFAAITRRVKVLEERPLYPTKQPD